MVSSYACPFLDRALVDACFRIPGDMKVQGSVPKTLLLTSLGVQLPMEIVNRPKLGFTLPFERWLRGELRPIVEDALLNSNWDQISISAGAVREVWNRFLAGETSWSRPWSLFVLKRWCDQHLRTTLSAPVWRDTARRSCVQKCAQFS